jgi:cytochrome c-type biogenesis protein CcmH
MLTIVLLFLLQMKVPDAASFVGQPKGQPIAGAELDRRTHEVGSLVRCPVCQGMSVADSPAEMAVNMKGQVRELLQRGYTEEQILDYFERSYGQFVLLKPKFEGVTAAVWIIPVLALLAGVAFLFLHPLSPLAGRGKSAAKGEGPREVPPDPYLSRVRELVGDKS